MKPILSSLLFIFQLHVFAQTESEINSDRPDQSDGTYIITKQQIQIENGVTFQKNTLLNNLMIRYGITKSTEVRLLINAGKYESRNGLLPIGVSFKQRLTHEINKIPAITFVAYFSSGKIASNNFKNSNYDYSLVMAFNHTITHKVSLAYNVSSNNIKSNINTTVLLSYAPVHKVIYFIEYFSKFEIQNFAQHNFDTGVLYHINNNLQVDMAFGLQLLSNLNRYGTTGFTYLF